MHPNTNPIVQGNTTAPYIIYGVAVLLSDVGVAFGCRMVLLDYGPRTDCHGKDYHEVTVGQVTSNAPQDAQ